MLELQRRHGDSALSCLNKKKDMVKKSLETSAMRLLHKAEKEERKKRKKNKRKKMRKDKMKNKFSKKC
jgi:hypothetical protein